jgi:flagellar basal body rod protein FlgC
MTAASPGSQMNAVAERLRACSDRRRDLAATIGNLRTDWRRADAGPFQDLIAAVSGSRAAEAGGEQQGSRLRVANVGRPHRPTKRNYDYFEELNAALAAKKLEQRRRDHG